MLKAVFIVSDFPSLDMLKIVAYLQYGPSLLSSLLETSATILSVLFFAYIHLGSCLGDYTYSYGYFQPSYPTPTCQPRTNCIISRLKTHLPFSGPPVRLEVTLQLGRAIWNIAWWIFSSNFCLTKPIRMLFIQLFTCQC